MDKHKTAVLSNVGALAWILMEIYLNSFFTWSFHLNLCFLKLLIAENAQISNTLTAGQIKVVGDITINSGEIKIQNENLS